MLLLQSACLAVVASTAAGAPRFLFDQTDSVADLRAGGFANDFTSPGFAQDSQGRTGYVGPLVRPDATSDWGRALDLLVQDGGAIVSTEALARVDGDGTARPTIEWKTLNILDSMITASAGESLLTVASSVRAVVVMDLVDLVPGQRYAIRYDWTLDARTDEEHDDLTLLEDTHEGGMRLALSTSIGPAPGPLFDRLFDNLPATGRPRTQRDAGGGVIEWMQPTGQTTVTIFADLTATLDGTLITPPGVDRSITVMRGTLDLELIPSPGAGLALVSGLALARARRPVRNAAARERRVRAWCEGS